MDTIDKILDREFPKEVVCRAVTMEHLAAMREALAVHLPPHSSIEVTRFMNSIILVVWSPGQGKFSRSCTVHAEQPK